MADYTDPAAAAGGIGTFANISAGPGATTEQTLADQIVQSVRHCNRRRGKTLCQRTVRKKSLPLGKIRPVQKFFEHRCDLAVFGQIRCGWIDYRQIT